MIPANRLGDPQVSPDGRWVIYSVTKTDVAANSRAGALYALDLSNPGEPVRLARLEGRITPAGTAATHGNRISSPSGRIRYAMPTASPAVRNRPTVGFRTPRAASSKAVATKNRYDPSEMASLLSRAYTGRHWNTAAALVSLTAMEIVLGIDNIIFIAILVGRMPRAKQAFTRQFGLALALLSRIGPLP
jgi:dipeptidyl aminopeptidase/acylaminoacyl peptidase